MQLVTRRLIVTVVVLSLIALYARGESSPTLDRAPYIQNVTPTSATIAWRTNRAVEALVLYREASGEWILAVTRKGPAGHYVSLGKLKPDTRYLYKLLVDGHVVGWESSFKTANGPRNTRFAFVAFGDSGSGEAPQWTMAKVMERLTFDLAIVTGDVVYPRGEDKDFDPHYFMPYAKLIDQIPFYPVLGNHDVKTDDGRLFQKHFYLPGKGEYYDFVYGHAHFIALNSNWFDAGDPQTRWLERTLEANKGRWKIVYFHHPPFSSGEGHGGKKSLQQVWVPLFERYGVDLVFSGHDHDYERTQPINGVVYVVTGGGGGNLYPVGQSPFTACSRQTHHVVHASVWGDEITLEAVGADGKVFDRYTLMKGATTTSPAGCRSDRDAD